MSSRPERWFFALIPLALSVPALAWTAEALAVPDPPPLAPAPPPRIAADPEAWPLLREAMRRVPDSRLFERRYRRAFREGTWKQPRKDLASVCEQFMPAIESVEAALARPGLSLPSPRIWEATREEDLFALQFPSGAAAFCSVNDADALQAVRFALLPLRAGARVVEASQTEFQFFVGIAMEARGLLAVDALLPRVAQDAEALRALAEGLAELEHRQRVYPRVRALFAREAEAVMVQIGEEPASMPELAPFSGDSPPNGLNYDAHAGAAWIRAWEARVAVEVAKPAWERRSLSRDLLADGSPGAALHLPLTRRVVDEWSTDAEGHASLEERRLASRRVLEVVVAALRYRLAHGELPHRAEQLVPEFLAELPADPFAPEPISIDGAGWVRSVGVAHPPPASFPVDLLLEWNLRQFAPG